MLEEQVDRRGLRHSFSGLPPQRKTRRISQIGCFLTFIFLIVAVSNVPWSQVKEEEMEYITSIWERKTLVSDKGVVFSESWRETCRESNSDLSNVCTRFRVVQAILITSIIVCLGAINVAVCSEHDESGGFVQLMIILKFLTSVLSMISWSVWISIIKDSNFQALYVYQDRIVQGHRYSDGFIFSVVGSTVALICFIASCITTHLERKRMKRSIYLIPHSIASDIVLSPVCNTYLEPDGDDIDPAESYRLTDKARYSSAANFEFEFYQYSTPKSF